MIDINENDSVTLLGSVCSLKLICYQIYDIIVSQYIHIYFYLFGVKDIVHMQYVQNFGQTFSIFLTALKYEHARKNFTKT